MARNRKIEYINKIRKIEAPNGYKFDLANYLYNPSYEYDYPSFIKKISEDETTETYRRVFYFKYCGGSGEYQEEIYTRVKNGDSWQIAKNRTENTLEKANRFNVNKLLTFC